MLRLHQHAAQARHCALFILPTADSSKPSSRQLHQRQMQPPRRACIEHSPRLLRCLPKVCRTQCQCPHHDVQFGQTWQLPGVPRIWGPGKRCPQSQEPRVCPHSAVQLHRRSPPLCQPLRKFPPWHKRQQPLRRPQRHRRRSRPRAFQADLPKMKFMRREVRVR